MRTVRVVSDSGTTKDVEIVDGAMVCWPNGAGDYRVRAHDGRIMATVHSLDGLRAVNLVDGSIDGTRWRLPLDVVDELAALAFNSEVVIEHPLGDTQRVLFVDLDLNTGRATLLARGGHHLSERPTMWRVHEKDLSKFREQAKVLPFVAA